MKYTSINEIDKFRFNDCILNSIEKSGDSLLLSVTALIVKADNSQNSNYTESYADETVIEIKDVKLRKIIKEGYKRYDAYDVLIEEIPDKEVQADDFDLKQLEKQYLLGITKSSADECSVEVEFMDEDPTVITDVYELLIGCGDITVSWDKYLNKVSQY